jgi:hypothetical protein
MRVVPFVVFAAVAVLPLAPLACGGSDKPEAKAGFSFGTAGDGGGPPQAANNCPPGAPCPPANCAPGQPCPPPAASSAPPPLGSVYTNDPNALASLLAAAAAAGSAMLGPAAAMADPAEAGLRAAAAKYAPGMSPEGQVAKGNLAEGGHVGFVANMDPSKCYTVVAFGAGVTDLDVNLLAPPFYNILAGQDGMAGPTAVIGAAPKPMCPIVPLSVPYKIDLYAKKGGGPVAAQVYSKPK